jgi:Flp pilus assembly protein TadG
MYLVSKRHSGERGAMIVQMAVASIAFLALAALAVDYGIKLIARTEAQRSADAGALAGAVSLAFDGAADPSATAKESAQGYALVNEVFGEPPDVDLGKNDVKLITCPPPNGGAGTTCVQVDVYRNQLRKNPLPTFFSRLVGVTDQGVQATATAKVLSGDTTDCLRPWAVLDRWDEYNNAAEPAGADYPDPDFCYENCGKDGPSTYDQYPANPSSPPKEDDLYVPPAADGSSPGTGFRTPDDIGTRIALKTEPSAALTSGWAQALDLPRADNTGLGGNTYGDNILSCSRIQVSIAKPEVPCPTDSNLLSTYAQKVEWAAKGCIKVQPGNLVGQTGGGGNPNDPNKPIEILVAKDPGAKWGTLPDGQPGVVDSCCPASPRIVPVAVFDPQNYLSTNPTGGTGIIRIVNIFGFFIEGMGKYDDKDGSIKLEKNGKHVIGRLMKFSGSGSRNVKLNEKAAWSKIIVLVR